jgi:Uma2 family endonuclease
MASVLKTRLFTAADLDALPTDLPSGIADYELDNGRLIVMSPPGRVHGFVELSIGAELKSQGERAGHARAFTDVGVALSRNPDTVFAPDVAFISKSKLPERDTPEGYLETIPDLVVEVRSKNDSLAELTAKAKKYLSAGVAAVWIADPKARTVTVRRPRSKPRVYRSSETMELNDPNPGFRLKVATVFGS